MNKRVSKNLRKKYNLLASEILGPSYYNSEMDRESADDAMCQAMIDKVYDTNTRLYAWKTVGITGWISVAIILMFWLISML